MTRERRFLGQNMVYKLLKEVSENGVVTEPIQFHMMGEPFLVKSLHDTIDYAHSVGLKVRLFTNGSLLNEETVGKLYDLDLEELVIGVQTWGSDSFAANRRAKIPYETYLENVKNAVLTKFRHQKQTKISIHYLNTKLFNKMLAAQGYSPVFSPDLVDTDDKAFAIIDEWVRFGQQVSDEIGLNFKTSELEGLKGEFQNNPLDCLVGDHIELLPGVVLGFKAINTFSDWLMKDIRYVERHKGFCSSIFEQMVILSNGKCSLCCVDYDGEIFVGDVDRHNMMDIWNGKEAQRVRNLMKSGYYPYRLCRVCKAFIVPDDYDKGFGDGKKDVELVHGFYSLEKFDEGWFRWIGKTAEIRVDNESTHLVFTLKSVYPETKPIKIRIDQGKHSRHNKLSPFEWTEIVFPLKSIERYGSVVRIETEIFFISNERDPDNPDTRELAVMCAGIVLRMESKRDL